MSQPERDTASDAPLNPSLKSTRETVYNTTRITPTPFHSASAKEGEGEGWPLIWLIVTVACVALAIWFIF